MNILDEIKSAYLWQKDLPTVEERKKFIEELEINSGFIGNEPRVTAELVKFINDLFIELLQWKDRAGYDDIMEFIDDVEFRNAKVHIRSLTKAYYESIDEEILTRAFFEKVLHIKDEEEYYETTNEQKFAAIESKITNSHDIGFLEGLKYAKSAAELASDNAYLMRGLAAKNILRRMNELETKLGVEKTTPMTAYQARRQEKMTEMLSDSERCMLELFAGSLVSHKDNLDSVKNLNVSYFQSKLTREYPVLVVIAIGKALNPSNFEGYGHGIESKDKKWLRVMEDADEIIKSVTK